MLRRHRLATFLLTVFIALASGVVVAAGAAASRANGSIERFTVHGRTFDVGVFSCPPGVDPNGFESQYQMSTICLSRQRAQEVASELAAMPGVESVTIGGYFVAGVLNDRAPNGWGQITTLTATLGNDPTLLPPHPKLLAGRLPNAAARDEVVLTERAAHGHGLHVGDRVTLASWPLEQLDAAVTAGARPDMSTAVTLRVVGIGRFGSDLAQGEAPDVSGNYFGGEMHTAGLSGQAVGGFSNYGIAPAVRLRDGLGGIDAFKATLSARWGDRFFSVDPDTPTQGDRRANEQRVDTERQGVLAFAVIAAIAAAGFAGLTLLRQLRREQADIRSLRHLGMTRGDVVLGGLLRALAVAAPATALTVVVAVALSPLGPVGLARRAEPDLGVHADWLVLLAGAAGVAVLLLAIGLAAPLLGLRPERRMRPAGGRFGGFAASLGAAPRVGMSFVRSSWPRMAAGVTAVALAALVAAGITVASLDRVVRSPDRFGAWWDADLGDFSDPGPLAAGARIVSADRDVTVVAAYSEQSNVATLDGHPVTLAAFQPVKGSPEPVVTRGRPPRSAAEISLGSTTLHDLGVDVGDTVRLSSVEGSGTVKDRALAVTGEVLFNDPVETSHSLGEGGVVTPDLLGELSPGVGQRLLARFADGADPKQVIERLARSFPGAIRTVVPPEDVRNMEHLRSLPWLLAALVGALAGVTLAHALVVTVRQRRRDLALLSVFGLNRWGARRVTAFSTLVVVVMAAVIGIPAGFAGGRLLWNWRAAGAGLTVGPVRTLLAPLELALGVLAAAQLVTLVATRHLMSTRPADLLRSE